VGVAKEKMEGNVLVRSIRADDTSVFKCSPYRPYHATSTSIQSTELARRELLGADFMPRVKTLPKSVVVRALFFFGVAVEEQRLIGLSAL